MRRTPPILILLGSSGCQATVGWVCGDPRPSKVWASVHAFGIEAGVVVGIVGVRAGFSPGEFVDFLPGWVRTDIAGDGGPHEEDGGWISLAPTAADRPGGSGGPSPWGTSTGWPSCLSPGSGSPSACTG